MRRLLWAFVMCALAGCAGGTFRSSAKTNFDLVPPEIGPSSDPPPTLSQVAIVVYDIRAPVWMDGTALYYRLAYENPAILLSYAHSGWVTSPSALLTGRLRSSIAAHGGRVVDEAQGSYALHAELLAFEQIFDTPIRSRGVLRLRATLEGRGIWVQRTFEIEREAPSSNAAGAVVALSECSGELFTLVAEWVGTTGEKPPIVSRLGPEAAIVPIR